MTTTPTQITFVPGEIQTALGYRYWEPGMKAESEQVSIGTRTVQGVIAEGIGLGYHRQLEEDEDGIYETFLIDHLASGYAMPSDATFRCERHARRFIELLTAFPVDWNADRDETARQVKTQRVTFNQAKEEAEATLVIRTKNQETLRAAYEVQKEEFAALQKQIDADREARRLKFLDHGEEEERRNS